MFNENWYSENQLNDLVNLVDKVKNIDGNIIEIGCWEGKSTISLANRCYPEFVICNDTWLGNVQESATTGITHITEEILKERDVYSIFINNMNNNTKKNYTIIKKDCIEWLKSFEGSIKFIHIDYIFFFFFNIFFFLFNIFFLIKFFILKTIRISITRHW